MSLDKAILFSRKLMSVTLEKSGPAPRDEAAQAAAERAAYERGYQEAADKFNAQILDMRQQMQSHERNVLNKMESAYASMVGDLSAGLPELVAASVLKIFGTLTFDGASIKERIEKVLAETCPPNEPVEVYLAPAELELVKNVDPDYVSAHPRLSFKTDAALKNGDCRFVSKFGEVDATIKTQLKRLMEEISNT